MYLNVFKEHLRRNELREAEIIINPTQLYDYFKISCDFKCYNMIDTLIQKYHFNVNVEGYFPTTYFFDHPLFRTYGETIVYYLSRSDDNIDVMSYLIHNYGLKVKVKDTIYFPLQSCLLIGFQKKMFNYLLTFPEIDIDIDILNKLILMNNLEAIKQICSRYIERYGNTKLKLWLHRQTAINYALQSNRFQIARYLMYISKNIQYSSILTSSGKYIIKLRNNRGTIPMCCNDIIIENVKPTFNEFYKIIEIISLGNPPCQLFDIREFYNLSKEYSFDNIYIAIYLINKHFYKFDIDSVRYFINLFIQYNTATFLQKRFAFVNRRKKNNKFICNVINIQRKWRRKKYIKNLRSNCSICGDYLFEEQCQKLMDCSHFFHKNCITLWRKTSEKTNCPICRTLIVKSPVNL